MTRRPSSFKQADIAKAARAATSAGLDIGRIEISVDGRIVLVMGGKEQVPDSLDHELAEFEARHGQV